VVKEVPFILMQKVFGKNRYKKSLIRKLTLFPDEAFLNQKEGKIFS
jgi:hypothetical protein